MRSLAAKLATHELPCPNQDAMVPGNRIMLDAKIAGINTSHVELQRQVSALRCKHPIALLAFWRINNDTTLPTLDKHTK